MSVRNALDVKRRRKLARQEQRKANKDAGLYQGAVRILRTHTSGAGVEYPPTVRFSGGNTTKAGRYRLSQMQGGRSSVFRLRHVPLRPELATRLMDAGLDRLGARKKLAPSRPAPVKTPAWPPWRDAALAARKAKGAA